MDVGILKTTKDKAYAPKVHETGAMRSGDADEARFDLIPYEGLERIAKVLKIGGERHGEHNWRKGTKFSVCANHCIQHIYKYLVGDRSEDHIAHAACNLLFWLAYETIYPAGNDLMPAKDEKKVEQ